MIRSGGSLDIRRIVCLTNCRDRLHALPVHPRRLDAPITYSTTKRRSGLAPTGHPATGREYSACVRLPHIDAAQVRAPSIVAVRFIA